ncbi:MAG: protein-L-isoaspartate(D-aspartate) O-methyltransferase [Planctomycetota bacterium]
MTGPTRKTPVDPTHAEAVRRMVQRQLRPRGLADAAVLDAMRRVPRHRFVGPGVSIARAYGDHALPIDAGQTISQPYVVARMTELLRVVPGVRVLEVGTGSGYQAAVLAALGAEVVTVERHAVLSEAAAERWAEVCPDAAITRRVGDGSVGVADLGPFDRIVVTAAAPALPAALDEQLAAGGRLVIPLGDRRDQVLAVFRRESDDDRLVRRDETPCRFVPLVGQQGWSE